MAEKVVSLTLEGKAKLEAELAELKSTKREEIAEKIKVARSYGDLSENSEYDEAKSEQGKLEAEILELETMISRAKIMEEDISTETVHIGSVVTIKETARGSQEKTFRITGFAQANPAEGKISDESPVGKALMGHKVGDKVVVEAPRGEMTYKIVKIDIESK